MSADAYIDKIRERLREAPDSKLFLTLAEELRIRGEKDEALAVLQDGIRRIPTFLPARVTLARWYYWDGAIDAAREEFRLILQQAPDHSFAKLYLNEIETRPAKAAPAATPPPFLKPDLKLDREPEPDLDLELELEPMNAQRQVIGRLEKFLVAVRQRFGSSPSSRPEAPQS